MRNGWKPITEFVNGSSPDERYPPEYWVHADGAIELRGMVKPGIEREPCCRLPEDAWPQFDTSTGSWHGFEHEIYRAERVTADGYVTIIEKTKYELLAYYLESP